MGEHKARSDWVRTMRAMADAENADDQHAALAQDELLMTVHEQGAIMAHVVAALGLAEAKFPTWPRDIVHGAAIVGEESGELIQAALQVAYEGGDISAVEKEAVHTAAMCFRLLVAIERQWK